MMMGLFTDCVRAAHLPVALTRRTTTTTTDRAEQPSPPETDEAALSEFANEPADKFFGIAAPERYRGGAEMQDFLVWIISGRLLGGRGANVKFGVDAKRDFCRRRGDSSIGGPRSDFYRQEELHILIAIVRELEQCIPADCESSNNASS